MTQPDQQDIPEPEWTDNSERPEDGPQDIEQDPTLDLSEGDEFEDVVK